MGGKGLGQKNRVLTLRTEEVCTKKRGGSEKSPGQSRKGGGGGKGGTFRSPGEIGKGNRACGGTWGEKEPSSTAEFRVPLGKTKTHKIDQVQNSPKIECRVSEK